MSLYEELQKRKINGEVLNLNTLSRNELKQLWFDEHYTDEYIAILFNTTPYKVNKRRRELKLMWKDYIWESCIEQPEFKKNLDRYILENNSNIDDVRNHILYQQPIGSNT